MYLTSDHRKGLQHTSVSQQLTIRNTQNSCIIYNTVGDFTF